MLRVVVRNEFEETEKIDRQENFGGGCTDPEFCYTSKTESLHEYSLSFRHQ
jgi:hypothetical protein